MPDQDNSFASRAVPEIQNKAPRPPGIMPKNAQTWSVVGVSAVMIVVIAFSSSGTPKAQPKSVAVGQQNSNPPSHQQINQYKAMVDDEARRLAIERQRLEQAKLDAQNAAVAHFGQLAGGPAPTGYQMAPSPGYGSREQSPEDALRLALEAERKKREYSSLFSSNISLSFRTERNSQSAAAGGVNQQTPTMGALKDIGAQLSALQRTGPTPSAVPAVSSSPVTGGAAEQPAIESPSTDAESTSRAGKRKSRSDDPSLQRAEGRQYRLFEGTVLEGVLTNRLNGSFTGPVNVMLTTNMYSHDHQQLLIPQGSRVLGEVQKVNSFGQQRLAVFFHRLIMPDGFSFSLDQFQGLNQIGETGLRDQVNHHYWQVFGVSLAIGAIAGVQQAGANYGFNMGGVDAYRRGVSESLSQSALRILDRYLNILPTFTVREGHRVKIYLSDDLVLPAYDRHRMPADL